MNCKTRLLIGFTMIATLLLVGCTDSVKDSEGTRYRTIKIGNQVWIAENLKTVHFSDSSAIAQVADSAAWSEERESACCWYDNIKKYRTDYGALYNRTAATDPRIAPKGWHLPTVAEWQTLITACGGEAVAGGVLKEKGFLNWYDPNEGGSNRSGFTAIPAGMRSGEGCFSGGFTTACFMAADGDTGVPVVILRDSSAGVVIVKKEAGVAGSVRLVRD